MMKIGDEVYIHGYVDEIRKDCIIIRNEGGYFGTADSEVYIADWAKYTEETWSAAYEKGREDEHKWWTKHCANCTDADGVLFKGNLKEGNYKLIKTIDGWVLQDDGVAFCGWEQTGDSQPYDVIPKVEAYKIICKYCMEINKTCKHRWNCPLLTEIGKYEPQAERSNE